MMRTATVCSLFLLGVCEAVFSAPARPGRTVVVESSEAASEAVSAALPGDVVVLTGDVHQDFRLDINGKGTSQQPITFRAQTPGKTRFTGDAHLDISGEHVIVEGFVFDQAWGQSIVEFTGATHCRLSNCAFLDCGDPKRTYRKGRI